MFFSALVDLAWLHSRIELCEVKWRLVCWALLLYMCVCACECVCVLCVACCCCYCFCRLAAASIEFLQLRLVCFLAFWLRRSGLTHSCWLIDKWLLKLITKIKIFLHLHLCVSVAVSVSVCVCVLHSTRACGAASPMRRCLSSCCPTAVSPAAKYRDCYHAWAGDMYLSPTYTIHTIYEIPVNHSLPHSAALRSISSCNQNGRGDESKTIIVLQIGSSWMK